MKKIILSVLIAAGSLGVAYAASNTIQIDPACSVASGYSNCVNVNINSGLGFLAQLTPAQSDTGDFTFDQGDKIAGDGSPYHFTFNYNIPKDDATQSTLTVKDLAPKTADYCNYYFHVNSMGQISVVGVPGQHIKCQSVDTTDLHIATTNSG